MIYNYRIGKLTDQDIINEVKDFCNAKHTVEDLLFHFYKTCDKLFMLHEGSIYHNPRNIKKSDVEQIVKLYQGCIKDTSGHLPQKEVVYGPKYDILIGHEQPHDNDDSLRKKIVNNYDSRMTIFIPQFFGIKYTKPSNLGSGWSSKAIPSENMQEHRKLYDILFSYCYQRGRDIKKQKEKNNNLGNLAKKSIFRFDLYANNEYSTFVFFVRKELLYRLHPDDTNERLQFAMDLAFHTSTIRNLAFSLIEQLKGDLYYKYFPLIFTIPAYEGWDKHCQDVYSFVIKKCKRFKIEPITIKEYGKKDKTVVQINMNEKHNYTVLYYAYVFFSNLETKDYYHDMIKLLFKYRNTKLIEIIKSLRTDEYHNLLEHAACNITTGNTFESMSFDNICAHNYSDMIKFIDIVSDELYLQIFSDEYTKIQYKQFLKINKEYLAAFLYLYYLLQRKKHIHTLNLRRAIVLISLFLKLKVKKINIPTASTGYNGGGNPSSAVKIGTIMESMIEEWKLRANGQWNDNVYNRLYQKNRVAELWLSSIMYMALRAETPKLFIKRLHAELLLYETLMQKIPSITKYEVPYPDETKIINTILFSQEQSK